MSRGGPYKINRSEIKGRADVRPTDAGIQRNETYKMLATHLSNSLKEARARGGGRVLIVLVDLPTVPQAPKKDDGKRSGLNAIKDFKGGSNGRER